MSRILLLLCVLAIACQNNPPPDSATAPPATEAHPPQRKLNVALLIMDGVYNTELTAPMDIFHHTKFRTEQYMEVFTIAKDTLPVTSFEGLKLLPDYSYTGHFPSIDILVVPSAEHHLDTDLKDTVLLDFIRKASAQSEFVTSHCDGAFILAKAGVLDGHACTTFPADIEVFKEMFPHLTVHETTFVHDGKFITSAGGARSFDAALYLHQWYYGKEATDLTAEGLVIDWNLDDVLHVIVD